MNIGRRWSDSWRTWLLCSHCCWWDQLHPTAAVHHHGSLRRLVSHWNKFLMVEKVKVTVWIILYSVLYVWMETYYYYYTRLRAFFSRTTLVSQYQKGETSLDLNESRDDGVLGRQCRQWDHMQTICTSLQTDNHTNTSPLNVYRPDALPDAQPAVKALRQMNGELCKRVQ